MPYAFVPGGVKQTQRHYVSESSDKEDAPASTGYTFREYAIGHMLDRDSLRQNPRQGNGWRDPSPYKLDRRDYKMWFGTVKLCPNNDPNNSYEYEDTYPRRDFIPDMAVTMPWPSANMINRAEVEALVKLKEQNVNYAVALAEAHKSLPMIEKSFWAVFDAYRYAKKKAWRQAARALGVEPPRWKTRTENVAGRWLELQYGWLPFLSDAYSAYEDARKGILRYNPRISVTRTVIERLDGSYDVAMDWGLKQRITDSDGSLIGCKVRLDYELTMDGLATASKVGLTNPAIVAWELVPFSFVLDWAVPVGNWLSAWDADFGLKFLAGSRTLFSRIKRTGRITQAKRARAPYRAWYADLTASFDGFRMDRTVYATPPLPVPYWKNPVSAQHALNALALLRALLK